jgi:hypothetical protein
MNYMKLGRNLNTCEEHQRLQYFFKWIPDSFFSFKNLPIDSERHNL